MSKIEKDEITGTHTTGHEWDGIKELNTPLPRWWIYTFYATIVWALAYTVFYPAWPLINGATPGVLGYSSRADVKAEMAAADTAKGEWLSKIKSSSLEDIMKDEALRTFAKAGGAAAFKVNCVQCHGSGAAGSNGYPNLNDNDWIWGGTIDQIHTTLVNGIRYAGNADTRDSQMPAYGADALLTPEQITDVANYVVSLSKGEANAEAAARGQAVFVEQCAACHGDAGLGNKELGSPNLVDAVWLNWGAKPGLGDVDSVIAQLNRPKHGVMPAWGGRLPEETVKQLAVFVYLLGGGEAAAP